jgi:hypothetical protein
MMLPLTSIFHVEKGLRQGCPLSPLLFLLVAEGLSRALEDAKSHGVFRGIPISLTLKLTHLLFVDHVLFLCNGKRGDEENTYNILDLFSRATSMQINERKSTLSINNMEADVLNFYRSIFHFEVRDIDSSLKYLGFQLKSNCYKKSDWIWLIAKLEKRLKVWSFRWLSRAESLVLVKLALESIPIYWMSIA